MERPSIYLTRIYLSPKWVRQHKQKIKVVQTNVFSKEVEFPWKIPKNIQNSDILRAEIKCINWEKALSHCAIKILHCHFEIL